MKNKLTEFYENLLIECSKHKPEILMGLGIGGFGGAIIFTGQATVKAIRSLDKRKQEENVDGFSAYETVKTVWKYYIPAGLLSMLSTVCIIEANNEHSKRHTALATAYSLSETALKEYQEKVVEIMGERKNQSIKDAVAKDRIEANPVGRNEIIITEKGNTLCYEPITGRYFKSDIDQLKRVANDLNKRMLDEMYISLNDFFYEIGLSASREYGDMIGWNVNSGLIDLHFSSQIAEDGTPCIVVEHSIAPQYNFMKF